MKKITKSLSSIAFCTLLYVPISSINAVLSPAVKTSHAVTANKSVAFLPPPPLPCGFNSHGVVSYPTNSEFFLTQERAGHDNAPILSATGSWFIAPLANPVTVPTQITNGSNKFILQADGNLVIYHGSTALWATGTNGSGAQYLFFKNDGNLILTSDADGINVIWSSGITTSCSGGEYSEYIFQNDGNLVMIYPTIPGDAGTQWYQIADTGTGYNSVSNHFGQIL